MARVFIGVGHGGSDPGAVANGLRESEVNLVMALACKAELERHGVTVGISRTTEESDPLAEEIAEANAFAPDIAVEIHNNAGGGDGFEVYRQTGANITESTNLAYAIERAVQAMGQNSRGVKQRLRADAQDYFGWLRQVNCPAVLCEGAFLDNAADAQMIDTIPEQEAFGKAYAKGVLDYLGIPWREDAPKKRLTKGYAIQEGFYVSLENAQRALEKAKSEGRAVFLVEAERYI